MKNLPHSVGALRTGALRNLPRFVFDFIDGGAGDETALIRNIEAFRELVICPQIGRNLPAVPSCNLFGTTYAAPFGIAPLGLTSLVAPRADIIIAKAAMKANIPYICSAASDIALEEIANETGQAPWFQIYSPKDPQVFDAILSRLSRAEVPVLVVTVDVPAPGRRLRDLHNGLRIPLKCSFRLACEAALHPTWAIRRLLGGEIRFPNFDQHLRTDKQKFHEVMAAQTGGPLNWSTLAKLRDRWPGPIVLKGILHAQDALKAKKLGFDGIIVSNHGGRQLDAAPAPIDVLSSIRLEVGDYLVMLDSGIRSGTDIVRAGKSGADFVFLGRPVLYALGSLGSIGPSYLVKLIADELENIFVLAGYSSWEDVIQTRTSFST